jgi:hypothetical protein
LSWRRELIGITFAGGGRQNTSLFYSPRLLVCALFYVPQQLEDTARSLAAGFWEMKRVGFKPDSPFDATPKPSLGIWLYALAWYVPPWCHFDVFRSNPA